MATLHLMVGLPCSGKTTRAKQLEKKYNALLLSPDIWHIKLFGNDMGKAEHEKNHSAVEAIMWDHAARVLRLGVDVILDFGFWGKGERENFRERAKKLGADFKIHYMDVPVNELYKRMEKRNKAALKKGRENNDVFILTKEDMDSYIKLFQPPAPDELA